MDNIEPVRATFKNMDFSSILEVELIFKWLTKCFISSALCCKLADSSYKEIQPLYTVYPQLFYHSCVCVAAINMTNLLQ